VFPVSLYLHNPEVYSYMKRLRKHIALIVAAVFIHTIFAGLFQAAYAAEVPVTVSVVSYKDGELTIKWNQTADTKGAVITYHVPDRNDKASPADKITVVGDTAAKIRNLKADYIYDINVTLYGALDENNLPTGEPVAKGLLFFLPSITFKAAAVAPDPTYVSVPGGGRESGTKPRLKLSWKTPKAFFDPDYLTASAADYTDPNPDNNVFSDASATNVKLYMEKSLNGIYTDSSRDLDTLNFRINISSQLNLLNSGSSQSAILIDQLMGSDPTDPDHGKKYHAYVSGNEGVKALVRDPDAQGFRSVELVGRADTSEAVPSGDPGSGILPDGDILPGTVYYMNIKPIYKDSNGAISMGSAVTVGDPGAQNGSMLSGEKSYVNTPIRFQLTKDSANNVYVKIYKINQGSLDLPRLYYEIQAADDPSVQGDWQVKKTMDDSYFSGSFAVTVVSGINPNNTIYYKIVVKSENPVDRLESLAVPYALTVDTSRPPLPMNIAVSNRELHIGTVDLPSADDPSDPAGDDITVKSTDVTFSWQKPSNWDEIKDKLYFHFLISTNQSDLPSRVPIYIDGKLWGEETGYDVKYRMVKYISAASADIKDTGSGRLEYTLDGFDLFKWKDKDGTTGTIRKAEGDNTYPDFLVPNTVYYLQMYTTIADSASEAEDADAVSDRSVIVSFTTLNGVELDVPLPMNFELEENGKMVYGGKDVNYIDLRFDKISNLDWKNYTTDYNELEYKYSIYYDIYMNSRTNTEFIPVGTTQDLNGDVGFTGADDPQSTSVIARISRFTEENTSRLISCGLLKPGETRTPRTVFGQELLPNTTYYFLVRARLVVTRRSDGQQAEIRESKKTAILPVTTIRLDTPRPDESKRKPLAPTDFGIANDSKGDQMVSGSSVTFSWLHQEGDVIYQIIRTTEKVDPSAGLPEYENDPEYVSFLKEYGSPVGNDPNKKAVLIDPAGTNDYGGKFAYADGVCTFTVDKGMFPNKLYYFSLKAIRTDSSGKPLEPSSDSVWVSIPVTTSLIDPPSSLEVIQVPELGFWWSDSTYGLTADDFRIYVKGPSDSDYKLINKAQSTIVRDTDAMTYYGRVTGLKQDTPYDVRVVKGKDTVVYERTGMMTRDGYHQLEIKWIGKALDDYAGYEIAIMEEGSSEYTILTAADLEQYVDKNGSVLPYYKDETARTLKSDDQYFYARIRTMNVTLPGGIVTKQPLRSNTRYMIKVRAVKADPVETDLITYSRYIGPVSFRTEFSQDDYDNRDREEQQKAVFLDKIKELEKGYFWRVAIGANHITTILLKSDRVADALKNTSGDSFVIDLTGISVNISNDEIYVPIDVIRAMKAQKKSLVIRTAGTELLLRPGTLADSFDELISGISARREVKDIYVKLDLKRGGSVNPALPSNQTPVSEVNSLKLQAQGYTIAYSDMAGMFHDRLYDEDAGLVGKMLDRLLNTYVGSGTGSSALIDQYARNLIDMMEKELSAYINDTLNSSRLKNAIRDITSFDAPAAANLTVSGTGKGGMMPYILYDGSSGWQKLSGGTTSSGSSVTFSIGGTGSFVILAPRSLAGDIKGHWAENSITSLASKYDLEDVFPGIQTSFMPNSKATVRELVLLYEKVTGKTAENTGLDGKSRLAGLGLDSLLSPNSLARNADRQQTAAILCRLFSVKKGVDAGSLRPSGRTYISDESGVRDDYYNSVVIIVDIGVMTLDASGRFNPGGTITRAEAAEAFVRLLRLTGDL
jgi:hypothetical protein